MIARQKISAAIASYVLMILACGQPGRAATITASTTGLDTGGDAVLGLNSFFQVAFDEGATDVRISSFTFDISPDTDGFFDPNGVSLFDLNGGVPTLGGSSGIAATDINFEILNGGKQLRGTLLTDAFSVGRSLTFGIDTDNVGLSEIPIPVTIGLQTVQVNIDTGADFGKVGALFSVELSDGTSSSTPFEVTRDVSIEDITDGINADPPMEPEPAPQSVAILKLDSIRSVPEPTLSTFAAIAILGVGSRVKRNRLKSDR
ncbi:hypothetical protein IQ235_05660 [Oscillatoriales cyanobacterium LEGE 11467]|uniref:PEP-CTERM protein-sorting domain-containing protein n=1 Tax=Zarconia navalis LEGE 11467 TaxID=1828826 RepID=A0A928VWZ2_9CYAN|nr:hypothetical protein [Zarconia navalis]MBE9040277.1 hypothetical protein [Zarconia navalis LEGE 11467]